MRLDVTDESAYPEAASYDFIFNANMVHIAEWKCERSERTKHAQQHYVILNKYGRLENHIEERNVM